MEDFDHVATTTYVRFFFTTIDIYEWYGNLKYLLMTYFIK